MKKITFLLLLLVVSFTGYAQEQLTSTAKKIKKDIQLIEVEDGNFTMGSKADGPMHQVTMTGFKMSKYETTNLQYIAFLNDKSIGANVVYNGMPMLNPITRQSNIKFEHGRWKVKPGFEKYPIDYVSWYGASEYCKWIGGSLPTEAQWEYASKGGTISQHYKFSGSNSIGEVAWYKGNGRTPQPVGQKKANELGLFDMSGNVAEWCSDYKRYYSSSAQRDPVGAYGAWLVIRGGSCMDSAFCTSTFRCAYTAFNDINLFQGVRPVFPIDNPASNRATPNNNVAGKREASLIHNNVVTNDVNATKRLSQTSNTAREYYARKKFGLFVHYIAGLTKDENGNKPTIDELANKFDAKQFAQDAADFGVEYVIFTVWHGGTKVLYPSRVNKQWRDDVRPNPTDPALKSYSDRDVIADLATELDKKGIELHLYSHPRLGVGNSREEAENTGWNNWKEGTIWNRYMTKLYDELSTRYKSQVKGYYIDALYFDKLNEKGLRNTILRNDQNLVIVGNAGLVRDRKPSLNWVFPEYYSWEVSTANAGVLSFLLLNPDVKKTDAMTWPSTTAQVALIGGGGWWAGSKGAPAGYSAKNLFLYLVMQAAVSKSGGFAIAAGCFPGLATESSDGTIWERAFYAEMRKVGKYVSPIAESIKNTNAGKAYVTAEHSWLSDVKWGVSTESADGKYVYLHVIKPPSGRVLTIGEPADRSTFHAVAIDLRTRQNIALSKVTAGYQLTLAEGMQWDELDTVIRLERAGYKAQK